MTTVRTHPLRLACSAILLCQILATRHAHAERIAITSAGTTVHSEYLKKRAAARSGVFTALTLRPITTRIRGLGRTTIRLQSMKSRSWSATAADESGASQSDGVDFAIVRGTFRSTRGGAGPLNGVFIDAPISELRLYFRRTESPTSVGRYYQITMPSQSGPRRAAARVRSAPSTILTGRQCGLDPHAPQTALAQGGPQHSHSPKTSAANFGVVAQIRTFYDSSWSATYGSSSNATIAAIVDAASLIYETTFGVQFDIVSQGTYSTTVVSNAETAIATFQNFISSNFSSNSADIFSLFTGTNTFGFFDEFGQFQNVVLGIAYTGAVCLAPLQTETIIRDLDELPSVNIQTYAHEVGHNFNALHDSTSPSTLMSPSLPAEVSQFSSTSRSEIENWITNHDSCLAAASTTPTPTPSPTPSQTPGSGATPQPTASPTATPREGGGGSIGELPTPGATTSLTSALSKSGTLAVTATIQGTVVEGCKLYLDLADNAGFKRMSSIALTAAPSVSITTPISVRVKPPARGKKAAKVYIRSRTTDCGGTPQNGAPRTLAVTKLPKSLRLVSVAKWIAAAKTALTE